MVGWSFRLDFKPRCHVSVVHTGHVGTKWSGGVSRLVLCVSVYHSLSSFSRTHGYQSLSSYIQPTNRCRTLLYFRYHRLCLWFYCVKRRVATSYGNFRRLRTDRQCENNRTRKVEIWPSPYQTKHTHTTRRTQGKTKLLRTQLWLSCTVMDCTILFSVYDGFWRSM